MTRAAIYARSSSSDAKGDSIDSQLATCRTYCTEHAYDVVAEFTDDNVSGADMQAPDLTRALDYAAGRRFDVLVTRELDRFARGLDKQVIKEYEFRRAGVSVEYTHGDYDEDTLEGKLIKYLRVILADMERTKIAERTARGRRRSVQRGNVMLAQNPPFGLRLVEGYDRKGRPTRRLEIDEEEAEWVRRIYAWYLVGDERTATPPLSCRKIARKLTELRVLTKWDKTDRGVERTAHQPGRWAISNVHRILTSRTYVGEWVYREACEELVVPVPAIIDVETFERVQRKLASARIQSPRNTSHQYLLRGRVLCASCGYRIHAYTRRIDTNGKRREYSYYRCPGATGDAFLPRSCPHRQYRADYVDDAVWEKLKATILEPRIMNDAQSLRQSETQSRHLAEQLELAERNLTRLDAKMDKLFAITLDGPRSAAAHQRQQRRLEREIDEQERRCDNLRVQLTDTAQHIDQARATQELAASLRDVIDSVDSFERRRYVVEVLDVMVRLENRDDKTQAAHIDISGVYTGTIPLRTPRWRTAPK